MTTNKKAAPAEAAENVAVSDTCDYITVLDTVGDPLTTFYRDGQRCINDAFNGASTVRKCLVENLSDVAELIDKLYREPRSCIVQGAYIGDGKAKRTAKGMIEAGRANFKDCLARLLILEVGWDTEGIDPVAAPEEAILHFIDRVLPEPFQDASFVWRMCRRSEHSGKRALKAHLVFWLERPMKLSDLDKWRESVGPALKPASCKPGHPIFTAGAMLEDGTIEPSQNRYGYFRAGSESVVLLLVERPAQTIEGIDRLTILETTGPHLTKTYKSDGTNEAYGDAASFKHKTVDVADLKDVRDLLGKLHKNTKRCLVRGAPKSEMVPGNVQGTFVRINANFDDQPLHWFMIDIDGYRPGFADPVLETELAVQDFLAEKLPPCFRTASFYWHLSSSAGMPGKEGILKCHLHMWSKEAYTTAQMYEWAKGFSPAIDKAVYRRVQIHFVADPLFEEGRIDPVPVRSGWHQGETDYVDLVITPDTLAQAREQGSGEGGSDMKLVDPSEKSGLVGLYNKVFTAEEVLLSHLEGEFEGVSERRYTWHNGGGTPEGVWVHDDGMHVGSSHNTWPIDGIANLWDLVRVFKFGHLDHSDDAFEQEDIDSLPIQAKPSNQAMIAWAAKLPELLEAQEGEAQQNAQDRQSVVDSLVAEIHTAANTYTLEKILAPRIKKADLSPAERAGVVKAMQDQFKKIGSPMIKADVTRMLAPPRGRTTIDSVPEWSGLWVWVTSIDKFMNVETKTAISAVSYNAKYDRFMGQFADENGNVPKASDMTLKVWNTKVVDHAVYMPTAELFFNLNRVSCVNTYRIDLLPDEPGEFTKKELAAIETVDRHFRFLCGDRDWLADTLVDWLAHNIQFPGVKIRFSPLIQGIPGDGKSFVGKLMAYTMGQPNVSIISAQSVNSNFSAWAQGCCLGVMEEIRMQGANRFEALNALKELITNDTVAVIGKGRDQINVPNTINYLATTNFRDALPLDDGDRRWMVIFTQWKNIAEFEMKVGCSYELYFERLSDAIENYAGALRQWLRSRPISAKFNRHGRAPDTDEKRTMISLGRANIDVVAENIIAEGAYGIYPDVLSSGHLTAAMEDIPGVTTPRGSAVSSMLDRLGYIQFHKVIKWHGVSIRPWTRRAVTNQKEIQELMDAAEAVRQADEVARNAEEIEKSFND